MHLSKIAVLFVSVSFMSCSIFTKVHRKLAGDFLHFKKSNVEDKTYNVACSPFFEKKKETMLLFNDFFAAFFLGLHGYYARRAGRNLDLATSTKMVATDLMDITLPAVMFPGSADHGNLEARQLLSQEYFAYLKWLLCSATVANMTDGKAGQKLCIDIYNSDCRFFSAIPCDKLAANFKECIKSFIERHPTGRMAKASTSITATYRQDDGSSAAGGEGGDVDVGDWF